ncbi:MAG TPA: cytochrome c3 family protein [Bacteroidales bacterium]|nr:cytochrome c3 family protein [Bacteroidales bacterium]
MFKNYKYLLFLLICITGHRAPAQEESEIAPITIEKNNECLVCHGYKYFSYFNEYYGRDVKERMNPLYIVDSTEFYLSNHRTFMCTDCHSTEYGDEFPHQNHLRFEPSFSCMDCHEGNDEFARFNFETIRDEFVKSVHSEKHSEDFTCWMCHNPHSYHISARNSQNLTETIRYDNQICLDCHSDEGRIGLLSDREIFNMLDKHEWLPNHLAHFKSVRCIECHAEVNDDLMVAHNILPKEKAVKKCVECHSQNSILMASLYKHQVQEKRSSRGYFNAAIMTETYVIGANRNIFLNIASISIFGLAFIGVIIHAILRKIYAKK